MEKFAERLKEIRVERGLSQSAVSKALGLSRIACTNYELGIREPSLDLLVNLCDFFEVSADYILGRVDIYYVAP